MKDTIQVVNKSTGEIWEWLVTTDIELAAAHEQISETIKALERAKSKIKAVVAERLNASLDDEIDLGSMKWRKKILTYKTYNLSTMHYVLERDIFTLYIKPNKTALDTAIVETIRNPEQAVMSLEAAHALRETMHEDRPPVSTILLEKVTS